MQGPRKADRESALRESCQAQVIGCNLYWYESVGSTNDLAKELAARGTPEGTVVVADEQTAGRGRRGASWFSPPGAGLWFSVVLRPNRALAEGLPAMNRIGAEAVSEALNEHFDIAAVVKDPNDVLADGKKICGVLCEAATPAGSDRPDYLVIGCGINLTTEFPDELRGYATNMAAYMDRAPDPVEVLARICETLEKRYLNLRPGGEVSGDPDGALPG